MKNSLLQILFVSFFIFSCSPSESDIKTNRNELTFSALKGKNSRTENVVLSSERGALALGEAKIIGTDNTFFSLSTKHFIPEEPDNYLKLSVTFLPDSNFIGLAYADLLYISEDSDSTLIPLRALSTRALEGENEAPLSDVLNILTYKIDLGWTSLANHIEPERQGDELAPALFQKANENADVEMIPIARYSPPFALPFGIYSTENENIIKQEVGVLSGDEIYPEHQTLFPSLSQGNSSFDVDDEAFGFYTTSPSHIAYSQDRLNAKHYPEHAKHAVRIYAAKDFKGNALENQYIVCFEEAANGDYQDYVFLLKNVVAVFEE